MSTPPVSVVVVTYKREAILRQTLTHLLELTYQPREIIVVDQTAQHEPETARFLALHAGCLRVIRLDRPSMTHARNVGARAARGEFVLYCDDDTIPPPQLIERHLANYTAPDVAGVTGGIMGLKPGPAAPRACVVRRDGKLLPFWEHTVPRGEVDSLLGCNMSWRRAVLLRAGGFDEGFIGRANWEETDLSLRVRRRGYRLLYDPAAAVVHLMAPDGGSRAPGRHSARYRYESHYNNAYFFAKHFSARYLPAFLKREVGWIVVKRGLLKREPEMILPALHGLMDGYRAGRRGQA
ncbi:MAG TPA: glycosyltransferase [Alphaproteobacteria bacterium]|nr:glycosyltransferase [Alphaproteobacteria bacterium]